MPGNFQKSFLKYR